VLADACNVLKQCLRCMCSVKPPSIRSANTTASSTRDRPSTTSMARIAKDRGKATALRRRLAHLQKNNEATIRLWKDIAAMIAEMRDRKVGRLSALKSLDAYADWQLGRKANVQRRYSYSARRTLTGKAEFKRSIALRNATRTCPMDTRPGRSSLCEELKVEDI
jgi:hypothetical protein